ncbi:MAG: ParB/RepB/Spo0J family partition protein [Candidatus Bathyarchaeia archaeon]|jgi:ParB-like chromosome segregation protein Spo0J
MKKKSTLKVPDAYLPLVEDLRVLKSDKNNPNNMTIAQKDQVWLSLQKYGWTYPIITNKEGVFADGEQRAEVCKDHGEFFAPVLRLPVSDVDRRMLRQILNKLRGKHSKELDGAEYMRIIEAGEKNCLKTLLESIGEKLPEELDGEGEGAGVIPGSYELIIECKDEAQQQYFFDKLKAEGYRVRVLNL